MLVYLLEQGFVQSGSGLEVSFGLLLLKKSLFHLCQQLLLVSLVLVIMEIGDVFIAQ